MYDATDLAPDHASIGAEVDGWTIHATTMPTASGGNVVNVAVVRSRRNRLTRRQSVRGMVQLWLQYVDGELVEVDNSVAPWFHTWDESDGLDMARQFVQANRDTIDRMAVFTEAKAWHAVGIDPNLLAIDSDFEQH